jgi:hypothetical protein
LDHGRVVADGATADVVRRYLAIGGSEAPPSHWIDLSTATRTGSGVSRFTALRYTSLDPGLDGRAYPGGPLQLTVKVSATSPVARATIGFTIRDNYGTTLMSGSTTASGAPASLPEGTSSWVFTIASLSLRPGTYQVDFWLSDTVGFHDRLEAPLRLEVFDRQSRGSMVRFDPRYDGPVLCNYQVAAVENDPDIAPLAPETHARVSSR